MSAVASRLGAAPRAIAATAVFAVAVAAFARVPLLPEIGRDLRLGADEIGLLTTAFGLGRLALDLPAGRLADVVAPRVGFTAAGLLLALGSAGLAVAESMIAALAASVAIGGASALTNTTGMYAFATASGARRRGVNMAAYTTALMTGQMLGPTFGGAVGSLAGWRTAVAVSAAIGIAVAAGFLVARWRAGDADTAALDRPDDDAPVAGAAEPARLELFALALAPFATFFGLAGITQTLIPLIGDRELGYSASLIGIAIGGGAALRFAITWIAGAISDRVSRRAVLIPSLVLMALGGAVLALPPSSGAWVASIVLLAAGSSAISIAAAAVADRVAAAELGRELGLFRLIGDCGLLIGPALTGYLYEASGPRLAGGATAAVFAAATVAALAWVRDEREPRPGARDTGEIVLE